jgi:hypothetical protein
MEEDYEQKAKDIFNLINTFRKNPRELAKKIRINKNISRPRHKYSK